MAARYEKDNRMAERATKLAEAHVLAAKGIMGLPAGLPVSMKNAAPLPIATKSATLRTKEERINLEPVLVNIDAPIPTSM